MQQAVHGHTRFFYSQWIQTDHEGNQLIPVCSGLSLFCNRKSPVSGIPKSQESKLQQLVTITSCWTEINFKKNPISLHSQSPSPHNLGTSLKRLLRPGMSLPGSPPDTSTVTPPTPNSALRAVTHLVVLPSPHYRKEETALLVYIQGLEYTRCLINSDRMESNESWITGPHPSTPILARAKQILPISWVAPMLLGCFQYSL